MAAISSAAGAYRVLAPFYDRLTADHDYERWCSVLEPLALAHGLEGRRLLDVACGTGKSFVPFLHRGYRVVACDLSEEMAHAAVDKAGAAAEVRVADMRELPTLGRFDLAICLGDAVNYLLEESELEQAFGGVARNLRPGGLFVFDANTLATYRSAFLVDRCIDDDDLFFAWYGTAAEPFAEGGLASATVEVFCADHEDHWRRHRSHHLQRHHPEPVIRRALGEAGYSPIWSYGQDRTATILGPPDEGRHSKVIYVARRQSRSSTDERR